MTASPPHAILERWIWILIYGGLLILVAGWVTSRADEGMGWAVGISGAVTATVGFVLVYVRSRMKD